MEIEEYIHKLLDPYTESEDTENGKIYSWDIETNPRELAEHFLEELARAVREAEERVAKDILQKTKVRFDDHEFSWSILVNYIYNTYLPHPKGAEHE